MKFSLFPLSFGRQRTADDAFPCSHVFLTGSSATSGSARSARILRCAALLVLAGSLPLAGLGQRHSGGGSRSIALSTLTCSKSTVSGAASDACTVTLATTARYRGTTVSLSSSASSLTVPASVVVSQGATSAAFTASVAAISSSQAAVLTASAGGVSKTFTVQMAASGTAALTVNSRSVAFGNVPEDTTVTQSVTLTSSGTAPLTLQSATLSGKAFRDTGITFPVTLKPNQSAILELQFTPTAAGAATGAVTIGSNASSGAAVTISLSGTGEASSSTHSVNLNWKAPADSPDPVAGYNIYRATGGGGYEQLNSSINHPMSYVDTTVESGTTYEYKVTSVDASGGESASSNLYTATIP